jgi:hypothetical protein
MSTGKPLAVAVAVLAATLSLSACDSTKKALGMGKNSPDEFAVYSRAPLSLPPDYGLRPPAPGSERPQAVNPRDQAAAALGAKPQDRQAGDTSLAKLSPGERALLQITGANNVDPSIRATVNSESRTIEEADKSFADKLVFWRDPAEFGTAVDAEKEQKRIREAQAAGKPINEGDVPTIERRQKGFLER